MPYVLIAEDDTDSAAMLSQFLQRTGYEVEWAVNGHEALASIVARPPDLLLLDLWMPVMNGADVLEVLRSYKRFTDLPVLVLTALPESELAERTRALGARAVLAKGKSTLAEIHRAVADALCRPLQ
jgi:CheY-like chemotaxis protein